MDGWTYSHTTIKISRIDRLWRGEVWRHVTMEALFLDDNKTNDDGDGKESGKKWYVYINKQQLWTRAPPLRHETS